LQKLHDDVRRQGIQVEQEQIKKFHQNQFLRLLEEDKNKAVTKENEKIKKVEELEQKRLKVDAEYHRIQVEA
jgi:hypothetical protein